MSSIYSIYNNEAFAACVVGAFIDSKKEAEFSEIALVLPFLLHVPTVKKLKGISNKRSLEELLTKHFDTLANFNDRFYDCLPLTVNALTLLSEMDLIAIKNKKIKRKNARVFDAQSAMRYSTRGKEILSAMDELIYLMNNESTSHFYSILRIEI